ncbi:hypothetical protein TNCV_4586281 [Trichonephila clavipes]|nr:hypothetical protein TNCV_4586281 [Trichonephila clavipes]
MPIMSASSCTFSRRSSSTTLWTFFTLLESTSYLVDHCDAHLGSSYCLVRLNFATQYYFTVVKEGADSHLE